MSASPLPIARPWTPPDTDVECGAPDDYFTFSKPSGRRSPKSPRSPISIDSRRSRSHSPVSPDTPSEPSSPSDLSANGDPIVTVPRSKPKPTRPKSISSAILPFTPTKSPKGSDADANLNGTPFPGTPDGARNVPIVAAPKARHKAISSITEPYTPTKPSANASVHAFAPGAMQFPPTPDSSQELTIMPVPKSKHKAISSITEPFTPIKHSAHGSIHLPHGAFPPTPDSARDIMLVAAPKSRHKAISSITEPYTPTKPSGNGNAAATGVPQYPYTPDSVRPPARTFSTDASPSFPLSWKSVQHIPTSPVQKALSSCILTLETLVKTRQPNDEQMEYIVAQIEAMASYLSSPDREFKKFDSLLLSGLEFPPKSIDIELGIARVDRTNESNQRHGRDQIQGAVYVNEVGKYIESVQKYTEDLSMRMDEIKQLNGIQLDIIDDLRRELRARDEELSSSTDIETSKLDPSHEENAGETIDQDVETTTPGTEMPRKGRFWGAFTTALDAVNDMMYEW